MDVVELIKRGYAALGLGADNDVLAMFDQLGDQPTQWVVFSMSEFPHEYRAPEVAAHRLFGNLPPHFEVLGVNAENWRIDRKRKRLTVSGHYRTRPRGTWDTLTLPFVHVWWIGSGRVERVRSLLDGFEMYRLPAAA